MRRIACAGILPSTFDYGDAVINPDSFTSGGQPLNGVRKPRRWRKRITLLALLLGLAAWYGAWRWMVTPRVNGQPQKKVVVRGVFPYDRGWDLQIQTSFYTRNPECKRTARAFGIIPMAEVAREAWADIPVTREGGNHYSFVYYEDYFAPGHCDWRLRYVYSHLFQDGKWEQGSSALMGLNRQNNQLSYDCHYKDSLNPGMGRDAREINLVCSNYGQPNNGFDPRIADNEVNFIFNPKTLYSYYSPSGEIKSKWIEGSTR